MRDLLGCTVVAMPFIGIGVVLLLESADSGGLLRTIGLGMTVTGLGIVGVGILTIIL